jgi:hypothetical protein
MNLGANPIGVLANCHSFLFARGTFAVTFFETENETRRAARATGFSRKIFFSSRARAKIVASDVWLG